MPVARRPPQAAALSRRRDERRVLDELLASDPTRSELETGEELFFQRPGIAPAVIRRLRQGRYAVREEIDLHGMTAREAREELRSFLAECTDRGLGCVRVIHGKGLRSGAQGPVLKASVNRWLRQWDDVLAFASAPQRDGGTGAVYVLLRR